MSVFDALKETVFKENGEQISVVFALPNENPDSTGKIMVSGEERTFLKKGEVFRRAIGDGAFSVYEAASDPEANGTFYSVCAIPFTGCTHVNILGAEYTITYKNDADVCAEMSVEIGGCGGYCSHSGKRIVIANLDKCDDTETEKKDTRKANLRHEIIHAFLNESGLGWNSKSTDCWAKNEEMVDWFALQGPKIWKAWQEAGAV